MIAKTETQQLQVSDKSSKAKKASLSVSFCDRALVYRPSSVDDFSVGDRQSLWLTASELQGIRRREFYLAKKVDESDPVHQETILYTYAIEGYSRKQLGQKRVRQYIQSVLIEQERQWAEDRMDYILLSNLSQHLSRQSRSAARKRGETMADHIVLLAVEELQGVSIRPSAFSRTPADNRPEHDVMLSPNTQRWGLSSSLTNLDRSLMVPQR